MEGTETPARALNCTTCFWASRTARLPSSGTVWTVPSAKTTAASALVFVASPVSPIGRNIARPGLQACEPSVTIAYLAVVLEPRDLVAMNLGAALAVTQSEPGFCPGSEGGWRHDPVPHYTPILYGSTGGGRRPARRCRGSGGCGDHVY